jgi:glycosyltransferase involved in cell wall biosynthesis
VATTPSTPTRPVTFCSRSYGYCRVGYELPVPGYRFTYRRAVPLRRVFPNSSFWRATRCFVPRVRGLVHTFNDIVINADAWMVSHELELPRFLQTTKPWHLRVAFERLADDRCRFILPMSEAARQWFLRRVPEPLRAVCAAKTQVFTGGVAGPEHFGLHAGPRSRAPHEPLHLVFVGNDAFRKGGPDVLDAVDRLRAEGLETRLTFVGRVDPETYTHRVGPDEPARLIQRLQTTPGVTWVPHAPNRDVLRMLTEAHLGLLPTLDDSLGWSAIEMASAGLPVIASNIVALPELVHEGVTGRLIAIPRDDDGRWFGIGRQGSNGELLAHTHDLLVAGLVNAIAAFDRDEDERLRLGRQARTRYEECYTPETAARRLQGFYDAAYAAPA